MSDHFATLCFGIDYGGCAELLPWIRDDKSLYDWWYYVVHGDKFNPSVNPYDDDGRLKPEFSDVTSQETEPKLRIFSGEMDEHEDACGLPPFECVRYGHLGHILAMRGETFSVSFCDTRTINPEVLRDSSESFVEDCREYGIRIPAGRKPRWLMSMYSAGGH